MAGVRRQSANCGGGEEEEGNNDGDNNDKDGVEDAKDAMPPRWPQGPGGTVKSLGSPIHPRVILPPPRWGGSIVIIKGRRGGGGKHRIYLMPPWTPRSPSTNDNNKND